MTDFRENLLKINAPLLIIHGNDGSFPFESTAKGSPELIKNSRLAVIKSESHDIIWTHGDDIYFEIFQSGKRKNHLVKY